MTEAETSLRSLYDAADQLRLQLDSLQASSEQYQAKLQDTISKYEKCRELVSQASLFSPNETVDDVATNDLRYLGVDYCLGELLSRGSTGDRKTILERSQNAYAQYLNRLDDYDLLSKDEKALFERYTDDKQAFSLLTSNDPATRRNTKIVRYQQEKELEQKIQSLTTNAGTQQEGDTRIRNLRLAELSLYTHQTFQALDMIAQELKILSSMTAAQSGPTYSAHDARDNERARQDGYSDRLDLGLSSMLQNGRTGPLLSKSGRPLQPFTLLDSRERLRNGVFRPGHNLPTMTIDEYLEEERRRGGIIEGGGEPPIVEPNEDDLEAADRETMKAREWDEFVESNPKGSGNTLNRG